MEIYGLFIYDDIIGLIHKYYDDEKEFIEEDLLQYIAIINENSYQYQLQSVLKDPIFYEFFFVKLTSNFDENHHILERYCGNRSKKELVCGKRVKLESNYPVIYAYDYDINNFDYYYCHNCKKISVLPHNKFDGFIMTLFFRNGSEDDLNNS